MKIGGISDLMAKFVGFASSAVIAEEKGDTEIKKKTDNDSSDKYEDSSVKTKTETSENAMVEYFALNLDYSKADVRSDVIEKMDGDKFTPAAKEYFLKVLSEKIYNDPATAAGKKTGIEAIFTAIIDSDNVAAFSAGMIAAPVLSGSFGQNIQVQFINKFIEHAKNDDTIGKDFGSSAAFYKLTKNCVETNGGASGGIITALANAWAAKPYKSNLFQTLSMISNIPGDVSTGGSVVPYADAVLLAIDTMIAAAKDNKTQLIKNIVQQLDPASIKDSGVNEEFITSTGMKISPAHKKVIEELLSKDDEPTNKAMLDALKDVKIFTAEYLLAKGKAGTVKSQKMKPNEDSVLKIYLACMKNKSLREDVISQGEKLHKLPELVTKYLIDDNKKWLRNPAHQFVKDNYPIGKDKDSPMEKFYMGNSEIGKVEDVCAKAPKGGEIEKQCEETVDFLYKEWDKRSNKIAIFGGLVASVSSDESDNPYERVFTGFSVSLDWYTKQVAKNIKLKFGANAFFAGGVNSFGGAGGMSLFLKENMSLDAAAQFEYQKVTADDNDLIAVAFDELSEISTGKYSAKAGSPEIIASIMTFSVQLAINYDFLTIKLGNGRTLKIAGTFGTSIGMLYGSLKDNPPKFGMILPAGADIEYIPPTKDDENATYNISAPDKTLQRNEKLFGFYSEYFFKLQVAFGGLF